MHQASLQPCGSNIIDKALVSTCSEPDISATCGDLFVPALPPHHAVCFGLLHQLHSVSKANEHDVVFVRHDPRFD